MRIGRFGRPSLLRWRLRVTSMIKSIGAAVVVLGLAQAVSAAPLVGDATAGQAKAAACAACHGADGNSVAPNFPRLAGQGARYIVKELSDFKAGRRQNAIMNGMAAGLSDQDMADVAAWFSSQKTGVGYTKPELREQGERIWRGGIPTLGVQACASCHGPSGQGMPAAGFPHLAGQHSDYVAAQLTAFRAAGRGDLNAPVYRRNDSARAGDPGPMQTLAGRLSDTDILALSSFIQGLH